MRILISNDDGIEAEGINQLRVYLQDEHELFVVAPDRDTCAPGHKINLDKPLREKERLYPGYNTLGWAVDGTPADCVKLGLEALLPKPPDLVISGINIGPNLGTDVLYSGTVSAAIEGIINGVPSLAVSLASMDYRDFSFAAMLVKNLLRELGDEILGSSLLNINVPPNKPRGIKVTKLGKRRYVNIFDKRIDPRGRVYFWMGGEPFDLDEQDPDTDAWAIREGYSSITPLHFDLTNHGALNDLKNMLKKFADR
jgi:5'-nucleotidase